MKTPQTREDWFAQKFGWLERAAIAAFVGIIMGLLLGSANVHWLATIGKIGLFIGLADYSFVFNSNFTLEGSLSG